MTYIVEIFSIAAGAFYIYMGAAKYGWWKGISISGGFMPIVCGALLVLFSVLMVISKARRGQKAEKIDPKALIPVGAMVLILLLNYLLGLVGACIAVAFLWLRLMEKYSWGKSAFVSLVLFVCVYGIFRMWLNVPFPTGLIGSLI